jgi:hypothetical protein
MISKYSEKTCLTATLYTTNPTQPELGSNAGHHSRKQANNCLSYATAQAIRDSKTLQTYKAKKKMGPGTELDVSASCNDTAKGRMITMNKQNMQ